MDNILEITLLFDFYGELLTEKQKLVFEMYYQNDFSYTEIAEELNISRQAACDQLKRTERILLDYEKKLGLLERFLEQKKAVSEIKNLVENIEKNYKSEDTGRIKEIAEHILSFD